MSGQPNPSLAQSFVSKAHPSRTCDYWLGGRDNYETDREVADSVESLYPHIRKDVRANRAFVSRAVVHLAVRRAVDQFVDLGCGLPRRSSPAEVVRRVAPRARIVCVDRDEVVRAHTYSASVRPDPGHASVLSGDLRDPDAILADLAALDMIDFTRPVGLVIAAVLHFIPNAERPRWIVERFVEALPPGSFVVLTHGTQDFAPPGLDISTAVEVYNRDSSAPYVPRAFAEVLEYFDGLDLMHPGLVQASHWQLSWPPERDDPHVGIYAGVGYKR